MKRREFITLLGGAAVWPLAARAQQGERMRRIGVLAGGAIESAADTQERNAAFAQTLQQLGWTNGDNVRIDYRYGLGNAANVRKYAAELVSLAPDVSWLRMHQYWRRCCRRRARCRSYSWLSSTLSVPALLRAWRSRAATPPASSSLSTA